MTELLAPVSLSPDELAQFERDGYLLGPQVLEEAQVHVLRAELARTIEQVGEDGVAQPVSLWNLSGDDAAPVWQIVNIWMASEPFRRLLYHPTITTQLAQLARASQLRIWHDQIQYKPSGVGGVNGWHQDAPLWPVLTPMTEVSAWVALDDVDESNGCMRMVRGSHLWGNQIAVVQGMDFESPMPSFEGHDVEVVSRPVPMGHVHYHHALTWHGSGSNRSARPRRAIALHFMTESTRFVASGNHLMKQFISVDDGAVIEGDAFPVVYTAPEG